MKGYMEIYHEKQMKWGKRAVWYVNKSYIKVYSGEKGKYIGIPDTGRKLHDRFLNLLEILGASEEIKDIYVYKKDKNDGKSTEMCFSAFSYCGYNSDEAKLENKVIEDEELRGQYWENALKKMYTLLKKEISSNIEMNTEDYKEVKKILIDLIPTIMFDGNPKRYKDYVAEKKKVTEMLNEFYLKNCTEEIEIEFMKEIKKISIDKRILNNELTEKQTSVFMKYTLSKVNEIVNIINEMSKEYADRAERTEGDYEGDLNQFFVTCEEIWDEKDNYYKPYIFRSQW